MVALNVMRWGNPGAAPTMVAMHGITSNGGAMCEPARRLAHKGWQVLAADMRGHGEVRLSVVPGNFGGNLDLPELCPGSTLYRRATVLLSVPKTNLPEGAVVMGRPVSTGEKI